MEKEKQCHSHQKKGSFLKRVTLLCLLAGSTSCAAYQAEVKTREAQKREEFTMEKRQAAGRLLKKMGDYEREGWHIGGGVIRCSFALGDDPQSAKEKARLAAMEEVEKAGIDTQYYNPVIRYQIKKITEGYVACAQVKAE